MTDAALDTPRPRMAVPVAVLAAVLVAALVGDRIIGRGGAVPPPPGPSATAALAPAGALSATWYCPGLGATPDSHVRGRIIIADPGPTDLHVRTTFAPATGSPIAVTAVVSAFTRLTYKLEEQAPSAFTATTVTIDGSGGAVEQSVQGPEGQSISPCATVSSDRWYFASGRTDTGATTLLSMYNPFPADAIVDLQFATDQGPTTPDAYQGLVVPAGRQMVVNVGDRVRLRTAIATTIAARSGRLVIDKLQVQQGQGARTPQGATPYAGVSVTLGDTSAGSQWYFADGVKSPGVTEHFDFMNPGDVEAQVRLAAILEQGSAEPFLVTVPPHDRATVQVDQEPRIPASVGQAWVATAANGVPFVVERMYEELPPAPHVGVADSMGAPQLARRWVFPAGSAANGSDEYLIVANPGGTPAKVTVTASGSGDAVPLAGLSPVVIPARSRQAIRIGDVRRAGIVVLDVTSDVAVVAERSQANVNAAGLSGSIGIPAS